MTLGVLQIADSPLDARNQYFGEICALQPGSGGADLKRTSDGLVPIRLDPVRTSSGRIPGGADRTDSHRTGALSASKSQVWRGGRRLRAQPLLIPCWRRLWAKRAATYSSIQRDWERPRRRQLCFLEAAAPRKRYNSAGTIHRRCAQCASSPKDDLTSAIHRLAQAARPGICGGRLPRCRGGATAGHAAQMRLRVRSSFTDSGSGNPLRGFGRGRPPAG